MIIIKSIKGIEKMRQAGRITAQALQMAGSLVKPGITTGQIDKAVHDFIIKSGATPSFLNYGGFPGSACISVNQVVIHGIPDNTVIREGDIVSIDVGAKYDGFHGDCADTFAAGEISSEAKHLIEVTRQSFYEGIKFAKVGYRISDISCGVENYCKNFGYGIVRDYTGHGVGRNLHEDPPVPNYGIPGKGPRLMAGMTIAVEPMINEGVADVVLHKDGWTVTTADGKLSAHYENTILITKDEPEILTLP